jgi:hypothetical protein
MYIHYDVRTCFAFDHLQPRNPIVEEGSDLFGPPVSRHKVQVRTPLPPLGRRCSILFTCLIIPTQEEHANESRCHFECVEGLHVELTKSARESISGQYRSVPHK